MDKTVFVGKQFKLEKDFTAWFGTQHKRKFAFWHKISDQSRGLKPCDAIYADTDGLYILEAKVIDGYTFNLNSFEEQQIDALDHVWRLCKGSRVIIYSKKTQEYREMSWDILMALLNGKTSAKIFEKSSQ